MLLYTKQSVANLVADALRKRIANGEFEPNGQKLPSEQRLAEEYGVGRSSIREALRTLQAEHAVRIEKGRGSFVLSPTAQTKEVGKWYNTKTDSLADLLDVRLSLETLAIKKCITNATEKDIQQLRVINNTFIANSGISDYDMLRRMDESFHTKIVAISDISVLSEIYKLFEEEYAEYRVKGFIFTKHIENAARGHDQIISALESRDETLAIQATKDHIFEVYEDVNKILTLMED